MAVDALSCPRRGAALRLVAAIEDSAVARRILECMGLPARATGGACDARERTGRLPGRVRVDFLSGTEVPDDERSKLDELARRLTERDGVRVDVLGCSDPSGSEALNLRISQARAESVAGTLEQLGLPGDRIGRVEGRGESREVQERAVFVTPRRAEEASS